MNVTHFISALENELKNELPGHDIQYEMAPKDRSHLYDE